MDDDCRYVFPYEYIDFAASLSYHHSLLEVTTYYRDLDMS
jgi:hypothetical protein